MIFKDSRYADGKIVQEYQPNTNTYQIGVYRTFPFGTARFSVYTWREEDRIDLIAKAFLGSPHLWWKIMDYNPEVINPFSIKVGTLIRIPNVQ